MVISKGELLFDRRDDGAEAILWFLVIVAVMALAAILSLMEGSAEFQEF